MATYVLRAAPDIDLYVLYCDSGNQILFVGDREETAQALSTPSEYGSVTALTDPAHSPEARLARADVTGTSALWNRTVYGYDDGLDLFWHLDVEGAWWLRRDRLAAYAQALIENEDDIAFALLEPPRHEHDDPPQAVDHGEGSRS